MAAPLFGVFFVGNSFPITNQHFTQVDATHWVSAEHILHHT